MCCQQLHRSRACKHYLLMAARCTQVLEAEAATAKIVAQMADTSAGGDAAEYAPLIIGRQSAQGQQQQQHSSDRENIPGQQQRTGQHRSKNKGKAAQGASKKQLSKRKKTSTAEPVQGSIPADDAADLATAEIDQTAGQQAGRQVLKPIDAGAAPQRTATGVPDPDSLVGCHLQRQFEEGLFKVHPSSINVACSLSPSGLCIVSQRTGTPDKVDSVPTLLHYLLHTQALHTSIHTKKHTFLQNCQKLDT